MDFFFNSTGASVCHVESAGEREGEFAQLLGVCADGEFEIATNEPEVILSLPCAETDKVSVIL